MTAKKKVLLILIAILSIAGLNANAQIKNTIFNMTLGQTTQQRALKIVEDKWQNISHTDETITCGDVEFAGYGWEKVVFYFYKSILYKVVFEDPYAVSEKNMKSWDRPTKTSAIMKNLREAAKTKYSKYGGHRTFKDGTTTLDFTFFTMTYENIPLAKKVKNDSLDDL